METRLLSRRKFCMTAAGASLSLAAGGVIREAHAAFAGTNEVTIDLTLSANNALTKVGGALYVTLPATNDKMIVVRNSSTEVSAFTSVCTHQGCQVNLPVSGVATCPCHGSQYSDRGALLQGPALSSLRSYPAEVAGNSIYINRTSTGVKRTAEAISGDQPAVFWRKERETLDLTWTNGASGRRTVSLFDVKGRQVSRIQREVSGNLAISTGSLPRGEYMVKIEQAGGYPVVRRVKIY